MSIGPGETGEERSCYCPNPRENTGCTNYAMQERAGNGECTTACGRYLTASEAREQGLKI